MARQGGYAGPGLLAIVGVALFTCLPQVLKPKCPLLASVGARLPDLDVLGSEVIELTGESIAATIQDNDVVMLEFFAPWCGHCKELAPEFEETADRISQSHPNVKLAKIDCTRHQKTCENYGVQGYPTLKIFRDQKAYDYNGARKAEQMLMSLKYYGGSSWSPPREITMELTRRNYQKRVDQFRIADFGCKAEEIKAIRDGTIYDLHSRNVVTPFKALVASRPYKGVWNRHNLETILEHSHNLTAVGIFAPDDDSALRFAFLRSCVDLRFRIECFQVLTESEPLNPPLLSVGSVSMAQPLRYRDDTRGEEDQHSKHPYLQKYEGPSTRQDLTGFFSSGLLTKVHLLTADIEPILLQKRPLVLAFSEFGWDFDLRDETSYWRQIFSEVVENYEAKNGGRTIQVKQAILLENVGKKPGVSVLFASGHGRSRFLSRTHHEIRHGQGVVEQNSSLSQSADAVPAVRACCAPGGAQDEADVSVAMMHSDVRKASNLYKMQGAELDDTVATVSVPMLVAPHAAEGSDGALRVPPNRYQRGGGRGFYRRHAGFYSLESISNHRPSSFSALYMSFAPPLLSRAFVLRPLRNRLRRSNKKAVKVVVARTFEKLVTRSNADVLIEFYAPWCPHCKRFAPKYRQLAKVERIPSIYLSRASDRANPVKYTGDLEAHALERFLVDMRAGATVPEDAATKDEL
eukprot:jgi/Bigna1/70630/fgenesh1_pg.12_\